MLEELTPDMEIRTRQIAERREAAIRKKTELETIRRARKVAADNEMFAKMRSRDLKG